MQKDLREAALYREVAALYTTLRQPGTGQISDAAEVQVSPDGHQAVFAGTLLDTLEGAPPTRICQVDLRSGETRVLTFGPNTDRLRYRDAGVSVVSLNVGFAGMSWAEHVRVASFMRQWIALRPLLQQLRYVIDRVGAEHVGLGLDYVFDRAELGEYVCRNPALCPPGIGAGLAMVEPEATGAIAEGLARENLTDTRIRGILGENWLRIATCVWRDHAAHESR